MIPLPTQCPFGGGEVVVTRFHCPESNITVEGRFSLTVPFAQLSSEQLQFVETFVRCEGKIKSMEAELSLSYPTIRNRLNEVIETLGYEPGGLDDVDIEALEEKRLNILESLDTGEIDAAEAMRMLHESEL